MIGRAVLLSIFDVFLSFPAWSGGPLPVDHESSKGVTKICDQSGSRPASIGVATMLPDGTIVYRLRGECIGQGEGEVVWRYPRGSAGYDGARKGVGGIEPGESKNIAPFPASIGVATMSADETISLRLWGKGDKGTIFEGTFDYKQGDPRYPDLLRHIGGIKPGEVKPVPPFTRQQEKTR
jgi:hypothetical protein